MKKKYDYPNNPFFICMDCFRDEKIITSLKSRQAARDRAKKYRKENLKKIVENNRKNRLKKPEMVKKWKSTQYESVKKYRENSPTWRKHHRARLLLNYHLKKGNITKPDVCEICVQKKNLDGHHPDYSEPLKVMWLCRACHATVHREERLHGRNQRIQEERTEEISA